MKMSQRSSNKIFKHEFLSVFAIIFLFGTIIMVSGNLIYFKTKFINETCQISRSEYDVSKIEIYNDVKMGEININMLPENSYDILKANWNFTTSNGYGPAEEIVTYRKEGDSLKIFIKFEEDESIANLNFNIFINPNYQLYDLISDNNAANIGIKAKSINFSRFEVTTTTGEIDIYLDYICIYNDLIVTSTSGQILFDCWELTFRGGQFNVLSDSGNIDIQWANHLKYIYDVDIIIMSNTYAKIKYWCPIEHNRIRVEFEFTDGSKRFSGDSDDFIELGPNLYQSANFSDTSRDYLNIKMITTSGYIWSYIVDCFKAPRDCNFYILPDFPWNTITSGSYTIPREGYDISTIKIYNTTTNAELLYSLLDSSSEYVLVANWSLIYQQGRTCGLGTIEIEFTHKIVGNILEIYIKLIYQPDLIRPIFTGGNIEIFTHPNYAI